MTANERLRWVLDNTFIIPAAEYVWMQTPNAQLGGKTPSLALIDGETYAVAEAAWAISMDNPNSDVWAARPTTADETGE